MTILIVYLFLIVLLAMVLIGFGLVMVAGMLPVVDESRRIIHQAGMDVIHLYSASQQAQVDADVARHNLEALQELSAIERHKAIKALRAEV